MASAVVCVFVPVMGFYLWFDNLVMMGFLMTEGVMFFLTL